MQLVIELPPREEQLAFNRRRWEEILKDPDLARIPGKVESNAHGQVLVMPPASGSHSQRTLRIQMELIQRLGGHPLPECPISTMDGVRAADVGWFTEKRFAQVQGQLAFETAPEICVEVLSPRNTEREMDAKKKLYFDAGAEEVWFCDQQGPIAFYTKDIPDEAAESSCYCPDFPQRI